MASSQVSTSTHSETSKQVFMNQWADQSTPPLRLPEPPAQAISDPSLVEAVDFYSRKNFPESITRLDQIVENTNNTLAIHYRGLACLKQAAEQPILTKQVQGVEATCCGFCSRTVTRTVPDLEGTQALRVSLLRKSLQDLERVFQSLSQGEANNSLRSAVALSVGICYNALGDESGTRAYIKRAIELDADNMEAKKAEVMHKKPHFYNYVDVTTHTNVTAIASAHASAQARSSSRAHASNELNFYY